MSLLNTTLWGSLLPGGTGTDAPDGSLDTTEVIDHLLPDLHAESRAALTFWAEAELIRWLDEGLKRLSRIACVFVGRDTSILTVAGQAAYNLPARQVATLHVSLEAAPLRPANMLELEMRDPAFASAEGTPDHWYEDNLGAAKVALAPVPDTVDLSVPVIYAGWPPEIDAGKQNTMVEAPAPLKAYLAMCALAEAYGQEGEMEMPDVAAHCRGRMAMYEQLLASYYGEGI